jgi:signal transduction histidine kinase/CheY-like chemotaxis protein
MSSAPLSQRLLGARLQAMGAVDGTRAQRLFGALNAAFLGLLLFGLLGLVPAFRPMYLGAAAVMLTLAIFLRQSGRVRLTVHGFTVAVFLLTALITISDGGLRGATFFWTLVPPLVTSRFMSARVTLIWSVVVVGFLGAVLALHLTGALPASRVPEPVELPLKFLSAFLFMAVLVSQGREQEVLTQKSMSELERLRDLAERANLAKSVFLANVSHELRTPLNGVVGFAQLLERTTLSVEQREYVRLQAQSSEVLLALIDDIIDLSRIETNSLTIEETPFDVRRLVDSVAELLAERAHRKQLALWVDVASDVPATVVGDSHRLRQVLVNLCGNAVKFTTQGEVVLSVTIHGTNLHFEVRDTGIGIPREGLAKLFAPFYQVDASRTRRFGGSGLGLSISRRLAERMGGTIEVTSVVNEGTAFSVTLPMRGASTPPTFPSRRAWVCGETACIAPVRRRLEAHGFEVHTCDVSTWRAALAQHQTDTFLALNHVPLGAPPGWSLAADWARRAALTTDGVPVLALPLTTASLDALSAPRTQPVNPAPDETTLNLKVLVAEDHPINQLVVRRLLERFGCSVTLVTNGIEAIAEATRAEFDLILMDCHMPEMDGIEATRQLRAQGVETFVCALTAGVLPEERAECFKAGMNNFLSKPLRLDELRAVLAARPVRSTETRAAV